MGAMALVASRSFLADDFSGNGLIKEMEKHSSSLGWFMLHAGTFAPMGITDHETKAQFWRRNSGTDSWKWNPYFTEMTM